MEPNQSTTDKDIAATIRRLLLYLTLASLELESLELDDRIKLPVRKKYKQYRQKFIDWTRRDMLTDFKSSKGAAQINTELSSEKVQDLKLLIDFSMQFENIGDILQALQEGLRKEEPTING